MRQTIIQATDESALKFALMHQNAEMRKQFITIASRTIGQKLNEFTIQSKEGNTVKEVSLMRNFMTVFDKMSKQVDTCRDLIRSIDREDYICRKQEQIAQEIRMFRGMCELIRKDIKATQKQLKEYQMDNDYLREEVKAIRYLQQEKSRPISAPKNMRSYSQTQKTVEQQCSTHFEPMACEKRQNVIFLTHESSDRNRSQQLKLLKKSSTSDFYLTLNETSIHTNKIKYKNYGSNAKMKNVDQSTNLQTDKSMPSTIKLAKKRKKFAKLLRGKREL